MSTRIGSPEVGSPAAIGLGVMNGVVPPCGTTAATVGIGALHQRDHAALGRAQQVGGEARDVMRAAHDDGAGAACLGHRDGGVERAQREPRAGKAAAVPGLRRGAGAHDHGLARFRHFALLDFGEIWRQQREAVRRMSEKVAGDEDVGDVGGDVGANAGAHDEAAREGRQRSDRITRRGSGAALMCMLCGACANRPLRRRRG